MENAIKKAIEGWYSPVDRATKRPISVLQLRKQWRVAVLDPLFWKALGKAEEWSEYAVCRKHGKSDCYRVNCFEGYAAEWLYHQHNFIDHIASGGSIDDFFNELLAGKE